MPFTNKSITEEESGEATGQPWANGDYPFKINEAEETQSKAGNKMIKLNVDIFKGARSRSVFHYIVFMDSTQWSARAFYQSIGMVDQYDSGVIDASKLIGAEGVCALKSEPDFNDSSKLYNKIDYFLEKKVSSPSNVAQIPSQPNPMANILDEDDEANQIPF